MKKIALPVIGCVVAGLLMVGHVPGEAQETDVKYFSQTGHYVAEPFLRIFEAKGGLQTWGPPITEAFEENGQLVQYFRRGRMECFSRSGGSCEVQISPLGELLGHRTARTTPVSDSLIRDGFCQHFPETGHNVCFSFLSSFLDHGGADVLGPPISELALGPGMVTQYFSRARMEWHFDAPSEAAIRLGALGEEFFLARGLDSALLQPVERAGTVETVTDAIAVGDYVRVGDTEGAGLRFRTGPGLAHGEMETLEDGTVLRVVGGPEVADGLTWWYLDHHGSLGWCAADWLERIEPPGSP